MHYINVYTVDIDIGIDIDIDIDIDISINLNLNINIGTDSIARTYVSLVCFNFKPSSDRFPVFSN